MTATNEVIRSLQTVRQKHQQRIAQIDAALALLSQDADVDELFALEVPRSAGIRETILAVMTDHVGQLLGIGEIYTAALDRGWRTTSDNPRNALASALARLATAGEIEKGDRGQYRLPGTAATVAA